MDSPETEIARLRALLASGQEQAAEAAREGQKAIDAERQRADRLAAALPPLLADCWRCKGTGEYVVVHSDKPEEVRTAACPRCGPARKALAGEETTGP